MAVRSEFLPLYRKDTVLRIDAGNLRAYLKEVLATNEDGLPFKEDTSYIFNIMEENEKFGGLFLAKPCLVFPVARSSC